MTNRTVKAELEIAGKDSSGPAFRSVATRMGQMERQFARFNKTAAAFDKRIAVINRSVSGYNRVAGQMGKITAAMRVGVGGFGIYEVARGIKDTVMVAANFEESLFAIQKKSGATAEQMAKLGDEIKGLATEMPVSIEEIASAFERGAAAGIPLDELREFAKLTAGVADAWDTSAENVGNIFAGFNVGLGIARKDLSSFASLINDLADSGIADETGIADFVDRVGASLKNFGMTPEEIAAYGAAMLNLKMPAEVGARAMDTLTGKLAAPENLSPKSRKALGAIVGDLTKFGKLAGNQKLTFFLKQLEKMTGQRRTSLLGALLGEGFDDEITRLVAGVEEVERNLDLARKHVANPSTSIVDAQTKKLDLFNSQLKIMGGHFDVIATNIGDQILPALTDVAKSINETLSHGQAISKADVDKSREELNQEFQWFYDRFVEENKDDWAAGGKAINAYDDARAMVGRGEIRDVYEYIERLRQQGRDIRRENGYAGPGEKPKGRTSMPVRFYREPEFPGGDHGYDPYNLPPSGVPIPGDRNAPGKSDLRNLQDQYLRYGNGRPTVAQINEALQTAQSRDDPALKGFLGFHGMDGNGAPQVKADEAEQAMNRGAAQIEQAGDGLVSGLQPLLREMSALTSRLSSIKITVAPSGGARVNADTGPSMPPVGPGGRPW